MKILIADDQANRYRRLIDALAEAGIARSQITIVGAADAARECMSSHYYDLLILDILIPLRPETEPDAQNALDLLVELHAADFPNRPGRIVGLTADLQVTGDVAEQFSARIWSVLSYSETNDEWVRRAVNCAQYIVSEKNAAAERPETYKTDLVIVCALANPELQEILKLPWNWSPSRPIDDHIFVNDGWFEIQGKRVTIAATSAPRMGMVSTALLCSALIAKLRPRLLALSGICAGVRGKVQVGDVLLADPAWDFQSGKRVKDNENTQFAAAPHQLYVPAVVRTHIEQIRNDASALASIAVKFGDEAPKITRIVIGPVASGSAVLADGEVVKEIKAQHRDLIGVEMEAYGLYAAANAAPRPRPLFFALKAVCDFADPDKSDNHQRYAAYASANVLRLLMDRYGQRLLESVT